MSSEGWDFSYKIIESNNKKDHEQQLDHYGADGFKMIRCYSTQGFYQAYMEKRTRREGR